MLPSLSHQNHFKFGYNGEWFRVRQTPEDVFSIDYGQCTADPGDFASASTRAARLIGEAADAPIHVLFSGGVDSEVTMLSFLAAKVPITAAIMRFNDDLNMHDIGFAIRFCQTHDVPYRLYDLDVMQFFEERILEYTIPTRCVAPMLAATMWLVDQIDGYPVMGQGECYLLRPEHFRPHRLPQARVSSWRDVTFTSHQWALQESESVNSWYRHFLLRGRNGVPGFHQYTPEQILSYLRDPGVKQMMATPHWNSGPWKLWVYQQHFPLAERSAFTGYEVIMNKIAKYRTGHSSRFPAAHSFVLFDYDTLVANLSPH